MLQKSLNCSSFSFLCYAAFVKQLWRQGWISLLHTFLNSFIIIMNGTEFMIVLLCLDLSWRHNAFTVDAGLPPCLLCNQWNLWWWKLLLTQTHCWHINISVIFYRASSGILGTVQMKFETIHDEQSLNCRVVWFVLLQFFSPQKKLPCFQTGCLLILLSNIESAWTLHHCACFILFFLS